jgi:hypothetical protein
VPDRHLVEVRHTAKNREVVEIEVVPGVDAKAAVGRASGSGDVVLEAASQHVAALLGGPGEWLRVQLNAVGAHLGSPVHGIELGVDEQADAHAALAQIRHHRAHFGGWCIYGPAGLTRDLTWPNRHERALVRAYFSNERQQIRPGVALDVELDLRPERLQHRRQSVDIREGHVACIGAGVHRDAMRAGGHAYLGRRDDGRHRAAARVADGGDLVDVD